MTQFIELETSSGTQCFNVGRIECFRQNTQDKEKTTVFLIPDDADGGAQITVHMAYNDLKGLLNAAGIRCS
ncbi:MAG: hypothetical protein OES26_09915 [Gammaproteobacteria bacterium]|nr:hypothetical protein [Gammaproteobacteria bacterium]